MICVTYLIYTCYTYTHFVDLGVIAIIVDKLTRRTLESDCQNFAAGFLFWSCLEDEGMSVITHVRLSIHALVIC